MTTKSDVEKGKIDSASVIKKDLVTNYMRHPSKRIRVKTLNIGDWDVSHANYIKDDITTNPNRQYLYFKPGTVVKVDFGLNVGSEISGSHYAVVVDKKDNNYKNQVTVVPLTSKNGDGKIPIDISFISEIVNQIESRIRENKEIIESFTAFSKRVKEILDSDIDNDSKYESAKQLYLSFIDNEIEKIETVLGSDAKINKDKLINEVANGDFDNYFIFSRRIDKTIESNLLMIGELHDVYSKQAKLSYAMPGSISTISKNRIRNKINKLDPMNDIVLPKNYLNKILKRISKNFGI